MLDSRVLMVVGLLIMVGASANLLAAGGTMVVATAGEPVEPPAHWPAGVSELVNDPARTSGWNAWFSEWPNDVQQFAFEVKNTADVNRLIRKLAAIEADLRQIRLSHRQEPQALGWVTRVPEGNGIAVIFSMGDQARIDQWYQHDRQPFGVMEFVAAPVAVPPTLTIFVRNEAVKIADLEIPAGIEVSRGYVPTLFHRSNTTQEQKQLAEAARRQARGEPVAADEKLDAASQAAAGEIDAFLKQRQAAADR